MDPEDGRMLPNFITQALSQQAADHLRRRPVHALAVLRAGPGRRAAGGDGIGAAGRSGRVYNLGNPEEHTILEYARMVLELIPSSSSQIVVHATGARRSEPPQAGHQPRPARSSTGSRACRCARVCRTTIAVFPRGHRRAVMRGARDDLRRVARRGARRTLLLAVLRLGAGDPAGWAARLRCPTPLDVGARRSWRTPRPSWRSSSRWSRCRCCCSRCPLADSRAARAATRRPTCRSAPPSCWSRCSARPGSRAASDATRSNVRGGSDRGGHAGHGRAWPLFSIVYAVGSAIGDQGIAQVARAAARAGDRGRPARESHARRAGSSARCSWPARPKPPTGQSSS